MGRITFANVVSDLYSLGVHEIDSVSILISTPEDMPKDEQNVALPGIIEGFKQSATIANVKLLLGAVNENPWMIIGGIASSICARNEFIMPDAAQIGDVLVLTKALGTQVAALVLQHLSNDNEQAKKLLHNFSQENLDQAVQQSHKSMARLNLSASRLMHKYCAHGCTDVTGFGILGHAQNLLDCQKENVNFVIEKLPIIQHLTKAAQILNHSRLLCGTSAETSGGLLIVLPESCAKEYCDEIKLLDNETAWIIGKVVCGSKQAQIVENVEIIEYLSK